MKSLTHSQFQCLRIELGLLDLPSRLRGVLGRNVMLSVHISQLEKPSCQQVIHLSNHIGPSINVKQIVHIFFIYYFPYCRETLCINRKLLYRVENFSPKIHMIFYTRKGREEVYKKFKGLCIKNLKDRI